MAVQSQPGQLSSCMTIGPEEQGLSSSIVTVRDGRDPDIRSLQSGDQVVEGCDWTRGDDSQIGESVAQGDGEELSIGRSLQSIDDGSGRCRCGDEEKPLTGGDVDQMERNDDVSLCGSLRSAADEMDGQSVEADGQRCDQARKEEMETRKMDDIGERLQNMSVAEKKGMGERDVQCACSGQTGTVDAAVVPASGQETVKEGPQEAQKDSHRSRVVERRDSKGAGITPGRRVEREGEAALFPSCRSNQFEYRPLPESDSVPPSNTPSSFHVSQSPPNFDSAQDSSPSPSAYLNRSRSVPSNRLREFYDLFLIYSEENESNYASSFRSYASGKSWKVTSTWELPIGPLNLRNFRQVMECCSYVVLLVSSSFLTDKKCERHYNIAIQYGDTNEDFYECVLPVVFDNAKMPPELESITHATWNGAYFDRVMTQSVDVQKRLQRECEERVKWNLMVSSRAPNRAVSVDATRPTVSTPQMVSSSPRLDSIPAELPLGGTVPCQSNTARDQPVKQAEQEACLLPSQDESPVLPPIHVAATTKCAATTTSQSLPTPVAATGNHPPQSGQYSYAVGGEGHTAAAATRSWQQQQHLEDATARQATPVAVTGHHPPQSAQYAVGAQGQTASVATTNLQQQQVGATPDQVAATTCQQATPSIPYVWQQSSATSQDYSSMTGEEIFRSLTPDFNPGQAASKMLSKPRFGGVCEFLDARHPMDCDWRLLAEILDISTPQMRILEQRQTGPTKMLLEIFFLKHKGRDKVEVLEELRDILRNMDRDDAGGLIDKEIMIAKCRRK